MGIIRGDLTSSSMFGCVKNRDYLRIVAIRNNNVYPNHIFVIRNSYNSYSLFLVNIGITTIQKCEERERKNNFFSNSTNTVYK